MTQVLLREHLPAKVDLDRSTVTELIERHKDHVTLTPTADPGTWTITPSHFVGTLAVGDLSILIRPKVPLPNLLALMEVEVPSETWRREVVGLEQDDDLLAVMARLFCVACEAATRAGLRRDYVAMEERLISPRGRIDVRAIAGRPGTDTPVPCRFDEHTADTTMNRLLRAALLRAGRIRQVPPQWRRRLMMQVAEFEDVGEHGPDVSWVHRWDPGPMDRHYEAAVRLGATILQATSASSQFGAMSTNTFLLNMNDLFERFVTTVLADGLVGIEVEAQAAVSLGTHGRVPMNPDIVMRRDGDVVAVADTKYKALDPDGSGRTPDYYQALAYATALGLHEAWLIYARDPGDAGEHDVDVRNSDVWLRTTSVDLNQPIESVKQQIVSLGTRLVGPRTILLGAGG